MLLKATASQHPHCESPKSL